MFPYRDGVLRAPYVDPSSNCLPSDRVALLLGEHVQVRQVTRPCDGLTAFDLAEIMRWAAEGQRLGIAWVEVHDGLWPDLVSDVSYIAVYQAGQQLPSYGLARRADGYHVWKTPCGEGLGAFLTLADALATMVAVSD